MSVSAIAVPGSVQRDLPPSDPISTEHSGQLQPSPELDAQQIASLAYSLWQQRGCAEGTPAEDWLEAERQLSAKF